MWHCPPYDLRLTTYDLQLLMNPIECIKMAVATLTADKLRSSLTMLGIVIGNASVIAMVGIGQGAQN